MAQIKAYRRISIFKRQSSLQSSKQKAIHLKPTRLVIKHCFFFQTLKRTLSFEDRNPPVKMNDPIESGHFSQKFMCTRQVI